MQLSILTVECRNCDWSPRCAVDKSKDFGFKGLRILRASGFEVRSGQWGTYFREGALLKLPI